MDEDRLSEARGEIIGDFIDLETMVNLVICLHYLGKPSSLFYYEVLYDEYFNFGLKLNILGKIVPQDRSHIENLRRLSKIRNYFAHRGTQFLPPGKLGKNGIVGLVPDPKELDKAIDYDGLYKEFQNKQPIEFQYLRKLIETIAGGELQ